MCLCQQHVKTWTLCQVHPIKSTPAFMWLNQINTTCALMLGEVGGRKVGERRMEDIGWGGGGGGIV